jgi:SAM-dependent methyltransferase
MSEYASRLQKYYEQVVGVYGSSYTGEGRYRSNFFRLQIVLALLDQMRDRPRSILDAGCGDARATLAMLRAGFDVRGYDNSEAMLEAGHRILAEGREDGARISFGDIYNSPAPTAGYDCLVCIGVVENLPNHEKIFSEFKRNLRPKGRLIVSLENDLFDLFTMNRHTIKFLRSLFADIGLPSKHQEEALEEISRWYDLDSIESVKRTFEDADIDKSAVRIPTYNPLNLSERLHRLGFRMEEVRFFHFHPLPPRFETRWPDLFQGFAEQLETTSYDWRGGVLCNCMVVQAQAID